MNVLLAIECLLCVVFLAITIECAPFDASKVELLLDKLEPFAKGNTKSSGLTSAQLLAGQQQFESWSEQTRSKMVKKYPKLNLLRDLCFIPMRRFESLIGGQAEQEALFIRRLEKFYKELRPLYFGGTVGQSYKRAPKQDELVASLLQLRHNKPLTLSMLRYGIEECKAFEQRCDDIVEFEDIYAAVEEFKLLKNNLNRGQIKLLSEKLVPLYDLEPPKNEQELRKFQELYQVEFEQRKDVMVKNGFVYTVDH